MNHGMITSLLRPKWYLSLILRRVSTAKWGFSQALIGSACLLRGERLQCCVHVCVLLLYYRYFRGRPIDRGAESALTERTACACLVSKHFIGYLPLSTTNILGMAVQISLLCRAARATKGSSFVILTSELTSSTAHVPRPCPLCHHVCWLMKCLVPSALLHELVFANRDDRDVPGAPGAGQGIFCVQAGSKECLPFPTVCWVFPGV